MMNLRSIGTVVVAFAMAGLSLTPSSPAAPTTQPNGRTSVLVLHGVTLASAIDSLAEVGKQKIFVNWSALSRAGVKRDLPVTVDLSDRSFDDALTELLGRVGGTHVSLGHQVDQGQVVISTSDDLAMNVSTSVYDIRNAIKGEASRQKDVEAVVNRVRGLDPLSWKDVGGISGSVRESSGQLIVTQTPGVHEQIVRELQDILPPKA